MENLRIMVIATLERNSELMIADILWTTAAIGCIFLAHAINRLFLPNE